MRKTSLVFICILTFTLVASAQDTATCKIPFDLKDFAAKATEVVDVTMDQNLLGFASNFLSEDKADEAQIKQLLSGIRNICVRSFKFDKAGQYEQEKVDALRSQFSAPDWSRIVTVRNKEKNENVDVMIHMEKKAVSGLVVVAAKPMEFTFVNIDGSIDPSQLAKLGGQFGIPKVEVPPESKSAPEGKSK
jgi:hypothetical protein